ncbi:hypothetical protein AAL_02233 [Moelleriella libera RCEF 2490]|uniref:Secreted protein n=1 Tax=Moelleriella libera RCEF 2490 TaxID=1081109 RepID=A0A168FAN2_9HYPO|nr:hypothetical protein AAL_02233 [Moelleriella libera RCEF 2490]
MKYSLGALASSVLLLVAPRASLALVGNAWSFTGNPTGGLIDVSFPFNMAGAAHTSGYYFAQQFNFLGVKDVGYCGIQNRPDRGPKQQSIVHGVFSSFQAGTTTADPNCHAGADGGPGVSCAVDFPGSYNDTYVVQVVNVRGTTWRGTIVNSRSKKGYRIGEWTLPKGAGGIRISQVGFVEYYPWNVGTHKCQDLPYTAVKMGPPTSRTKGAGTGTIGRPYEYGDCVGKVRFATSPAVGAGLRGGWDIRVGF